MSDDERRTSDEMEDGLNTGADLAGRAIKGLPSRRHSGGDPAAAPSGPSSAPQDSPSSDSEGPSGSDSPGNTDAGHSDSPQNSPGGSFDPGGTVNQSNAPGGSDGNFTGSGGDPEYMGSPGTGSVAGSGAEGAAAGGGASGSGATAASSGTGAEAGAGAAGAAAEGGAAAGGAAAGGAAGGAASGAAAGATAGSAAGPAGTAAGAVAGALLVPILKFIGMAIAVVAVFLSFFMMQPSFLYDNSNALNDRELLEKTYNTYYEHISDEYQKDIQRAMDEAVDEGKKIFNEAESGGLSSLAAPPDAYPHISMQEVDQNSIRSVMNDGSYDKYEFTHSVAFLRGSDEYLESASSNINLVLSLIDTQKKNWFTALFELFANEITGGLYGQFTDWIGRKWDGIWNEFIIHDLYSITYGGVTTRTETRYHADGTEYEITIAVINIKYTYDLKDKGISFYADKLNADQEQIDRAAEMANYLADLFGSASDTYFGMYVEGGYYTDSIQGGTVGANIANALQQLKDMIDGMEYDPGGTHTFPLQGYTNPNMSSHYGPRDFASDPWHTGIDFAAPSGTPILAATDGVVLFIAQMPNGFGNYIVVYHGDYNGEPVCTMYAHMSAFGNYRQGDPVSAGDVIGYVGSTGLSTGPHLHFQLHVGDTIRNPVEFFEFLSYLRP